MRISAIVIVAGSMAAALLSGCAQKQPSQEFDLKLPPSGERLAESIRLTALGQEAQDKGDDEAAIELYKQATTLSADAPSAAWNNLGMLYMERNEYLQATVYLRTAAQFSPNDPQPVYNLGVAFHRAGWDRDALDAFLMSLDREPNYLGAIRGAATSTRQLSLTDDKALERLKHAMLVETDPTWREFYQRERLQMEARLAIQDR